MELLLSPKMEWMIDDVIPPENILMLESRYRKLRIVLFHLDDMSQTGKPIEIQNNSDCQGCKTEVGMGLIASGNRIAFWGKEIFWI